MDEFPYPNCGSVIKSQCMYKIETTDGKKCIMQERKL